MGIIPRSGRSIPFPDGNHLRLQVKARGVQHLGVHLHPQLPDVLGGLAPPLFMMMLPCQGLTCAWPLLRPFRPSSSMIWPLGFPKARLFLKKEPAQGLWKWPLFSRSVLWSIMVFCISAGSRDFGLEASRKDDVLGILERGRPCRSIGWDPWIASQGSDPCPGPWR
jgi:hypothetical protein